MFELESVYSLNGQDRWTTEIDDIESDIEDVGDITLFVGKQKRQTHDDFLNVHCLIENMQENAYFGNEFDYDYLDDITDEQRKELYNIVKNWLNKNAEQPKFYEVVDVEEVIANYDGYSLNW